MGSRETLLLALAMASAFPFLSTAGATETAFTANSWDMLVTYGTKIHFFKNDTEIRKSTVDLVSSIGVIIAFAYDSVDRTLYISDGFDIRSGAVEENLDSELTLDRILHTTADGIWSMVFDPVTNFLFWAEGNTLMKMDVASHGIDSAPQISKLLDSTDSFDVTLDICHRFIYWTNRGRSIERSRLDGTDREVILTIDSALSFEGLTVDHYGGKLYFGTSGDNWFKIEESNLDGTDRRVLVNNIGKNLPVPSCLAVDDTALYWTDRKKKATIEKVYKNGIAMTAINEVDSPVHDFAPQNIFTRHSIEGVDCKAVLGKEQIRMAAATGSESVCCQAQRII